mmetsp:Transcript_2180/g.5545  ORF Transcript_2180/g.5545 Transcript_2180/m.5545 type:complete len:329 (+) Transcript_2180:86-1072(+)
MGEVNRNDGEERLPAPSGFTQVMLVAMATGCDQILNYPMLILSKRLAAGLGCPRFADLYKGCAAIYCTYMPTVAVEDQCTRLFSSAICRITTCLSEDFREVLSAACGGAAAGVLVANPTESIVIKAHARNTGVMDACRAVWRQGGARGLLCPHGSIAMMSREAPFTMGLFFLRDRMANFFHGEGSPDISSSSRSSSDAHGEQHVHLSSVTPGGANRWRWWSQELAGSIACAGVVNIPSHPASVVLAMQQAYDLTPREACRRLYHEDGLKAFFRGYLARTAALAGTMFIVPAVLSLGASHLGRWEHLPKAAAVDVSTTDHAQGAHVSFA